MCLVMWLVKLCQMFACVLSIDLCLMCCVMFAGAGLKFSSRQTCPLCLMSPLFDKPFVIKRLMGLLFEAVGGKGAFSTLVLLVWSRPEGGVGMCTCLVSDDLVVRDKYKCRDM